MKKRKPPAAHTGVEHRKPPASPGVVKSQPKTEPPKPRPGGRHPAITENLQSWRNYKTWADKMRSEWDKKN